jgi:hypothetical protein
MQTGENSNPRRALFTHDGDARASEEANRLRHYPPDKRNL